MIDSVYEQGIDITRDYNTWIRLGFVIYNVLGSQGIREFHRISCFHPEYDYYQTEHKFLQLASASRYELNVGSFIYLARMEGWKPDSATDA